MLHLLTLLLAQAAAAAPVPPGVPSLQPSDARAFVLEGFKKEERTAKLIKGQSPEQLSAALTNSLSGKSKLIFQPGHGVYVEYTAPDGQLRMWYPRNVNVVRGSWAIRTMKGEVRSCFRYKEAVDPVTQIYEPTECVRPVQTLSESNVLKSWSGDAFHLMSGRIPYSKGAMDLPSPEMVPPSAS
jgi:hypothetical protein